MPTSAPTALTYLKLSDLYDREGQPQQRDRFLVLAADASLVAGRYEDAEKLRLRLLSKNPHHLLRPYASFAQAIEAAEVKEYVRELRSKYPPEKAADLLAGADQVSEEPSVYRLKDDSRPGERAGVPARPTPQPRPTPPSIYSLAPERISRRAVSRSPARRADLSSTGADSRVSTLLFVLVLVAGIAFGAYTLLGPALLGHR